MTAGEEHAQAFVFETELEGYPGVARTIAVEAAQTLETLHTALRNAYGWDDDHLYAFWLDGAFWGASEHEYTAPYELEESGAKSADVRLDRLELEVGQRIAYVFDFGDEWRVLMRLADVRAVEGKLPRVLEERGEPPPQYA